MLLYNLTLIVEETVSEEFLNWIKQTYIPSAIEPNLFVSNRLLKVVDSPNEGVTFCLQFVAENERDYQDYKNNFAPQLEVALNTKFANRFVSYSTLMEFISS